MLTKWSVHCNGALTVLACVVLGGCGPQVSEIQFHPSNRIPSGSRVYATVEPKSIPANSILDWKGHGVETKPSSKHEISVEVIAPQNPGPNERPCMVTLEVLDGKTLIASRTGPVFVLPESSPAADSGTGPRSDEGSSEAGNRPAPVPGEGTAPSSPTPRRTDSPPKTSRKGGPDIQLVEWPRAALGKPGLRPSETIRGKVTGVKPEAVRVVVYAFDGETWWVQPYKEPVGDAPDGPITPVGEDGLWTCRSRVGIIYAALLVTPSHKPGLELALLPPVGGTVLAVAKQPGK
jgi:hypothetical protein